MPNFESGVAAYVHAQAVVDVYFPIDHRGNEYVCCEQCKFYSTSTRKCHLNGEVVSFPAKYVGSNCPLTPIE